jgi:hypothetical protein
MQIKNVAIRLSVSLAAVAIVVPLVSRVNHFARASQSPIKSGIELKADGNPMPPVPPPKGWVAEREVLSADGNPMPPVPPPPKRKFGAEVLVADGNPMPPVPPPKNGPHNDAEVLIADGNPMPPVPPPTGRIEPGLSVA